jgi:hypothetical protein
MMNMKDEGTECLGTPVESVLCSDKGGREKKKGKKSDVSK